MPSECQYIRGQLEQGKESNYIHWQILVAFKKKIRLGGVKSLFGDKCHAEPSRSKAATEYVWKDDTAITATRFELGKIKLKRNCSDDWEAIRDNAKCGRMDDIPADVYVRYYRSLKNIATDHLQPVEKERNVFVFWGKTGTGKSRRAWREAGLDAYPKDPRCKFWDGYRSHSHVVIDEFRGAIDIAHLLRWFDRYPVIVEVKGGSVVFVADSIWITSNLHPRDWYPGVDTLTMDALLRRLNITQFCL